MHQDWCGRPCDACDTSCVLDESIPCSPNCELLNENGDMADYLKCLERSCDVIQLRELFLAKDEVDKWQRLLDMSTVDFSKENIDSDCTLEVWSVEFDDGYVADLKVCSGSNNLFLDAILFQPCDGGNSLPEVSVPECPDVILGDHVFAPNGSQIGYVMRVALKS